MKKIYQTIICPIRGTMYLVGGYKFGHQWRQIKGEDRIFCRRCLKQKKVLVYSGKYDEKIITELGLRLLREDKPKH